MQQRWAVADQLLDHRAHDILQDEERPDRKAVITQDLDQCADQLGQLSFWRSASTSSRSLIDENPPKDARS